MEKFNFEILHQCPLCDSTKWTPLAKTGRFGEPANVVFCENCSLGFLNPRWNDESYLRYYKGEYDLNYRKSFTKGNREDSSPENLSNAKAILNRIEDVRPKFEAKSILDIGAADGKNIAYYRDQKFREAKCYAIEPSENCKRDIEERGIVFLSNDANSDWESKVEQIDLIVLRHVLEHFLTPAKVLAKIHNTLSENGLLYIAVPNSLNPRGSISKYYFRAAHTFYFNVHTLKTMLAKRGFRVEQIVEGDEYNPTELFVLASKGNVSNWDESLSTNPDLAVTQIKLLKQALRVENSFKIKAKRCLKSIFNIRS